MWPSSILHFPFLCLDNGQPVEQKKTLFTLIVRTDQRETSATLKVRRNQVRVPKRRGKLTSWGGGSWREGRKC